MVGQGLTNMIGNAITGGGPAVGGGGGAFTNLYSAEFDGLDDYIATDSTYSVLDGQTKMSISLWFYPTTTTLYQILFSTVRDSTANNFQIMATFNNYKQIRFFTKDTGKYTLSNLNVFTVNAWNHVVITLDVSLSPVSDRCRIYVNGTDQTGGSTNQTITALETSNSTMSFGINQNNKYNEFTGKLDEVAVWSGTMLTPSEVNDLYNGGTPTDLSTFSTPPSNWWRMGDNNGGTGTVLSDAIGSASATLINGTSYSTDVP